MKNENIFIFDIETAHLDGNRGHILCAAGKYLGDSRVYSWSLADRESWGKTPKSLPDDRGILTQLVPFLENARVVVAYYGGYGKFDVPFVNTRLLANGMKPLKQLTVVDPYQIAKGKLKLARNNLDSVATLLGCQHHKTHLPWEDWDKAKYGDRKAMRSLIKYNKNDVVLLEEVYIKLLPLFKSHPPTAAVGALSKSDACRVCGNPTYSKGWRYLTKTRVHDVVCKSCGWRGDGRVERL